MKKMLVMGALAMVLGLGANQSNAQAPAPYTTDTNTLHLWHFDEGGTNLANDEGSTVTTAYNDSNVMVDFAAISNATLDGGGYSSAFGGALSIPDTSSGYGLEETKVPWCGADGAFTIEAMLNVASLSGNQEIFSLEDEDAWCRLFQFKLTATDIVFQSIAAGWDNNGTFTTPIPTTGDNAFVADTWFHVALTYTGDEATTDNTKLYWTRVDTATESSANLISTYTSSADCDNTFTPDPCIGNECRDTLGEGLVGLIDEVRISNIAREADDFIFSTVPVEMSGFSIE